MWFKWVELSTEGILVPGSALDHTRAAIELTYDRAYNNAFERAWARAKIHDRAHATYTYVFRVALTRHR
jgi:hypothetical protein